MSKSKEVIQKENVVQAIIVADTFDDEFRPISDTIPHVRTYKLYGIYSICFDCRFFYRSWINP